MSDRFDLDSALTWWWILSAVGVLLSALTIGWRDSHRQDSELAILVWLGWCAVFVGLTVSLTRL